MEETNIKTLKTLITSNKTTIIRIVIFVVIAIIVYLMTRLKFTIDDIRKNWNNYKCKYPYSMFGGYLSPDGIRDKDGNIQTGMHGSKIHYAKCNKGLHKAFTGAALAPLYVSYGNNIKTLKNERKKLSTLASYSLRIREMIGEVFKRVFKFLLVIYYIIVYCFEKIKQILFKVQGVLDVILDTFKVFLRFVNYLLFELMPNYLTWQVSMLTLSLSRTLYAVMFSAGGSAVGLGALGGIILKVLTLGAASGPALPFLLVLAVIAMSAIFFLFLWSMGQTKDFIKYNTQFTGIGDIDGIPLLEGKAYDYLFDPITAQSRNPAIKKHSNSAGSILNILSIITLALGNEQQNDTSSCFTENTLIRLKNYEDVAIEHCSAGDTLNNGETILGVMIYKPQSVKLYNYKGVTMTGSHYIYENKNNLIACRDIGLSIGQSYERLYCPVTSNGKLQLSGNNTIDAADYNDGKTFSEWNYITDKKLNGSMNYTESDYKVHNYAPLFVDKDITEKECLGSIKYLSTNDIKLFDYNGIIVSGNVLVNENGLWKRIWQTNAKRVENNYKYLYNIVTDNHNIEYKNILFKDFEETNI